MLQWYINDETESGWRKMAFGIHKKELEDWKRKAAKGEIAFITHYWYDPRFPEYRTVTKAGCQDIARLKKWGEQYGLDPKWIHYGRYPHFDLLGNRQKYILHKEQLFSHLEKFQI